MSVGGVPLELKIIAFTTAKLLGQLQRILPVPRVDRIDLFERDAHRQCVRSVGRGKHPSRCAQERLQRRQFIGVWIFWGESKALFLHLTNRCRVT